MVNQPEIVKIVCLFDCRVKRVFSMLLEFLLIFELS